MAMRMAELSLNSRTTGTCAGRWHLAGLLAGLVLLGCDFNPCVGGGDIEQDSDQDMLPDCLEQGGITFNDDDTVDFVTNTNPQRADIFVKLDWMDCGSNTADDCSDGHSHAPNADALQDVTAAFASSPFQNPDGSTGIDLHIEMGEALTHQTVCDCACIANLVDNDRQILSVAEKALPNAGDFFEAKRKVVHYFLWSHQHTAGDSSSGYACPNGYTHVSLGAWGGYGNRTDQAGTFMHELGHQLGLPHGGSDGVNYKPNYLSVMNYSFQVSYSGRLAALDYSRTDLDDLDETNLVEASGIGPNTAILTSFFNPTRDFIDVSAQGPIDWNQDGDSTDTVSGLDINNDGVCVGVGDDDVLDSRQSGDDQYFAKNRSGWMVLSDTTRANAGDDDKYVDASSGETRISTGVNAILDTPVAAGDVLRSMAIVDGPDRTCDTGVSGNDEQIKSSGAAQTNVLGGHDDWNDLNLRQLFDVKGGFGETPPSSTDMPNEQELTFERSLELKPSDVVIEVQSAFTPRDRLAMYDVVVSNAGPEATKGPVHADLVLPETASEVTCQAAADATCVLTETGDKVLLDTPELAPGEHRAFSVVLKVDASLCATPEAYEAAVRSSILNIELDTSNDTYSLAFPDADGDGIVDVCGWPITDFAVMGAVSTRIGDRSAVNEAAGPFARGVVAKKNPGDNGLGAFRIGVSAITGEILSNGNATLEKNAVVDGDVVALGRVVLRQGVQVSGTVSELQAPTPALPELELFADFSGVPLGDIVLGSGASVAPAPGRYGIVSLGAGSDLHLQAGDYRFDQLLSDSRLHFDTAGGPIRVFVRDTLVVRGQWLNGDAGGVLLGFAGTSAVSVETNVAATILAPFAHVALGSGTARHFTGAVLANEVLLRPDVVLTHRAFRGTWPWNP
jgi:hypothetical protein